MRQVDIRPQSSAGAAFHRHHISGDGGKLLKPDDAAVLMVSSWLECQDFSFCMDFSSHCVYFPNPCHARFSP